jgi:hypothetical protein
LICGEVARAATSRVYLNRGAEGKATQWGRARTPLRQGNSPPLDSVN